MLGLQLERNLGEWARRYERETLMSKCRWQRHSWPGFEDCSNESASALLT